MTCENLQEENEELNAKLYQAQKEAMNLLILSGEKMGNNWFNNNDYKLIPVNQTGW